MENVVGDILEAVDIESHLREKERESERERERDKKK